MQISQFAHKGVEGGPVKYLAEFQVDVDEVFGSLSTACFTLNPISTQQISYKALYL